MSNYLSLFKKELVGYFQSLISYIFIVVFLVVISWLFWQNLFIVGQTTMRGFFSLVPWFFLFLVPALSMRLWSEEKKLGTLETLFTLPISDRQAVVAKFSAAAAFLAIVLLFSIPLPITLSQIGSLDWGPVIGSYVGSWLLGCSYLALGQWISSLTKNQIVAFLITIAVAFLFLIIGLSSVLSVGGALSKVFYLLSTQSHFDNLAKGVIDLRDVFYYMSFIAIFLYLNIHTLAKRKKAFHTISQVILGIAIIVLANILLMSVSVRIDLTENKQYTLSDVSKQIMQELSDPVTVKVYLSEEVPQGMIALKQDIQDLMKEYQRVGGNNLILEITDPKQDDTALQEVQSYNIPELQFNIVGNEKFEVTTGYAGIAIIYGEEYEVIQAVTDTASLEYDLTAAVQKMTREDVPAIGVLSDHGVTSILALQRYLEQQYSVLSVTLDSLDNELDALLIAGPTEEFTLLEQYKIDQYLMNGGKLFILHDAKEINDTTLQVTDNAANLNELLSQYGITVNNDLIADYASGELLTFGGGIFQILREYPLWPVIVDDGFDSENPITAKMQSTMTPWPSSLTIEAESGVNVVELLKTTSSAYAYTDLQSASPDTLSIPAESQLKQELIGALLSGNFTSKFANMELPEGVDANTFVSSVDNGTIFVMSNSRFISDGVLSKSIENGMVLVNALDTLTQEQSLVTIRNRSSLDRPIKVLEDATKVTIKYVNIFSAVIIVLIVAGGFFIIRRRKDKKAGKIYV